ARPGEEAATKQGIEKCCQRDLKQQGYTQNDVETGVRLELIREKVQQKVTASLKITDNDIKTYYDKHKNDPQYQIPAAKKSRDVRHILAKTKALADRIYAQLQANP